MNSTSPRPRRTRRTLGPAAAAVLATAGAAAVVTGVGVTAASASTNSDTVTVEAFRETVKPWDSIRIPSLTCPAGSYLVDQDLSPGRIVPNGVQVLEPGGVGVTISATEREYVTVGDVQYRPITGTTDSRGSSSATNWDPFTGHELVINLTCTTNIYKASQAPR
jgi:hypothetical protein